MLKLIPKILGNPKDDPKIPPRFKAIMNKNVRKQRKPKKSKKADLNVKYNDLERKDNYVFFELLATYADQYLERKEASTTAAETEKRLR